MAKAACLNDVLMGSLSTDFEAVLQKSEPPPYPSPRVNSIFFTPPPPPLSTCKMTNTESRPEGLEPGLIESALELGNHLNGGGVAGALFEGFLELLKGLINFSLVEIDPSEVEVGIMPRLIPRGTNRLLQPGNGFLPFFLLNVISADVVVRIPEGRIHRDGFPALSDGSLPVSQEGIGP